MTNELRIPLPTHKERKAAGRALREKVKRGDLGRWRPTLDRRDPVDLVEMAHVGRLERLIPLRVGRGDGRGLREFAKDRDRIGDLWRCTSRQLRLLRLTGKRLGV